ncbi:uncharacterized protein [Phaseolus vulgaris]|uniref:uncharacterized protein n=1 Tax=Phaseolus vulgaris TaxID=3885 RepID=UPI0035CA2CB6
MDDQDVFVSYGSSSKNPSLLVFLIGSPFGIQQTLETVSLSDIDGLLYQENIAKEELDHALHYQYLFWKKRANMIWFKDGDRNVVFFHVAVKRIHNSSGIHRLRIDNEDISNMEDFIGTYIPELVSSKENMMLIKCPNFLEIKNVVFNLNGNSALGFDGFGGIFYHSCWEIIGTDGADSIKDYWPIIINFKFKIISKILANRLELVVARIISPNQYGFVKGRKIQDCIGIASKTINMLSKKVRGGVSVFVNAPKCQFFQPLTD